MRTPLVAGNWKMNGSRESIKELINGVVEGAKPLNGVDIAVCPSAIHIDYFLLFKFCRFICK